MKLKFLTSSLTLLLCLFVSEASAYDAKIDGIYYIFSGTEAKVTYLLNGTNNTPAYSGDVVIPETVRYDGTTYKVTTIGNWAFQYSTNLKSVTIPSSVTSFGDHAFYHCI
ncbi:MAG: leucine-rich repeat protein [Bacteroidaceae bacterium]|nr:leucine-rich repeat protein [Bacteroidaceae bacterium]MBP1531704.1 leucine-rich repeat protein [Bacteroidaceae bacterium]